MRSETQEVKKTHVDLAFKTRKMSKYHSAEMDRGDIIYMCVNDRFRWINRLALPRLWGGSIQLPPARATSSLAQPQDSIISGRGNSFARTLLHRSASVRRQRSFCHFWEYSSWGRTSTTEMFASMTALSICQRLLFSTSCVPIFIAKSSGAEHKTPPVISNLLSSNLTSGSRCHWVVNDTGFDSRSVRLG